MPSGRITVADRLLGTLTVDPEREVGDVVVRRADGLHAYQLAVVVDDAADGVTDVVRGDDLWPSTPAQAVLQGALGLPPTAYAHVPLVLGADGARLAKRHASLTIAALRDSGLAPRRVIGALAHTLGLAGAGESPAPVDLVNGFRIEAIPREPVVVRPGWP
jgi:glutamyl-tRNA synthetase